MNTKHKAIRLLIAATILGAFASFAYAGPGIQYWQTLHKESDYKQLQSGEKVAYVCNQCKTVSEITITSPEQAMALCKEGAAVTCPSCKMTTKVVVKGKHNDPSTTSEVTFVNDKGEECAFMAKVSDKK
jgi:DNA-directed RNA polymerase subunit RPC12/RpoP